MEGAPFEDKNESIVSSSSDSKKQDDDDEDVPTVKSVLFPGSIVQYFNRTILHLERWNGIFVWACSVTLPFNSTAVDANVT